MPTVPNEILFAIIDFLSEDSEDSKLRKTHLALRLTCRAASDAATPYALRSVHIAKNQEAAVEQMESMMKRGYAKYVTRLNMDVGSTFPLLGPDASVGFAGDFMGMLESSEEHDGVDGEKGGVSDIEEKAGFMFDKLSADGYLSDASDAFCSQTSHFLAVFSRFLSMCSSNVLSIDVNEAREVPKGSGLNRTSIALRRAMSYATLSFALASFDFRSLERISVPARGNFTCPSRRHMSRTELAQEYLSLYDRSGKSWDKRMMKLKRFRVDYLPDKYGAWGAHRYRTWGHHKLFFAPGNLRENQQFDVLHLLLSTACRDVAPDRFSPLVRLRIDDLSVPGPELHNAIAHMPGLKHLSLRSITLARYDQKLREGVRTGAQWSEFFTACRSTLTDLTVLKLDRLDYGQSEWPSEAHYPLQSELEDDFYRLHELSDAIHARRNTRGLAVDEKVSEEYPNHATQRILEIMMKKNKETADKQAAELKAAAEATEAKRSRVVRLCHKLKKSIL